MRKKTFYSLDRHKHFRFVLMSLLFSVSMALYPLNQMASAFEYDKYYTGEYHVKSYVGSYVHTASFIHKAQDILWPVQSFRVNKRSETGSSYNQFADIAYCAHWGVPFDSYNGTATKNGYDLAAPSNSGNSLHRHYDVIRYIIITGLNDGRLVQDIITQFSDMPVLQNLDSDSARVATQLAIWHYTEGAIINRNRDSWKQYNNRRDYAFYSYTQERFDAMMALYDILIDPNRAEAFTTSTPKQVQVNVTVAGDGLGHFNQDGKQYYGPYTVHVDHNGSAVTTGHVELGFKGAPQGAHFVTANGNDYPTLPNNNVTIGQEFYISLDQTQTAGTEIDFVANYRIADSTAYGEPLFLLWQGQDTAKHQAITTLAPQTADRIFYANGKLVVGQPKIQVVKTSDDGITTLTGDAIHNMKFTLRNSADKVIESLSAHNNFTSGNLLAGDYSLWEEVAPNGYEKLTKAAATFSVDKNGVITHQVSSEGVTFYPIATHIIRVNNHKIPTNLVAGPPCE